MSALKTAAWWSLLAIPIGLATGSTCAGFLWLLDRATAAFWNNGWLLIFLPLSGLIVALLYRRFGGEADRGNNLVLDCIHEPGSGRVPLRIAPLVLLGTVLTHVCGGSAGREGTAVQMGGGIAGGLVTLVEKVRRLTHHDLRAMLMAGVAGGFGGVFGTPLAGMVFAIEVPTAGRLNYAYALPCLVASVLADRACGWWGIHHTAYPQLSGVLRGLTTAQDWLLIAKVAGLGIACGLVARLFVLTSHGLSAAAKRWVNPWWLRPLVGGCAIIGLTYAVGSRDFLGLGVTSPDPNATTIVSAFQAGGADAASWLLKLVFTVVTLAAGFRGGEVTPLFYIGSTFGNAAAGVVNAPVPLFAGLGFVAVFAGATHTPLACVVMAVELFGPSNVALFAVACLAAHMCSGRGSIYTSQRSGVPAITAN